MMKKLNKNNATRQERKVIVDWIENGDYIGIKKYFYGQAVTKDHENKAILLDKMFDKYDSFLPKDQPIYRGILFVKSAPFKIKAYLKLIELIQKGYENKKPIYIDRAPSSFTRNRDIAFEKFSGEKIKTVYSVVFILKRRGEGELYIKDFTDELANEEEIVIKSHKVAFMVQSIKYNDKKTLIVELEEYFEDE